MELRAREALLQGAVRVEARLQQGRLWLPRKRVCAHCALHLRERGRGGRPQPVPQADSRAARRSGEPLLRRDDRPQRMQRRERPAASVRLCGPGGEWADGRAAADAAVLRRLRVRGAGQPAEARVIPGGGGAMAGTPPCTRPQPPQQLRAVLAVQAARQGGHSRPEHGHADPARQSGARRRRGAHAPRRGGGARRRAQQVPLIHPDGAHVGGTAGGAWADRRWRAGGHGRIRRPHWRGP
mmetsp:Transcript_19400/g.50060  ORF Transcript_19400/g.50060 Transcript_19400/m.50060 type:complete len:239 (+) Transcript_19400:266-982(+)